MKTNEERATELLRQLDPEGNGCWILGVGAPWRIARLLDEAEARGAAAEREACARYIETAGRASTSNWIASLAIDAARALRNGDHSR